MDKIIRLLPLPSAEIQLKGAYLAHDLRTIAGQAGRPFVYANFITSLDGRIAIQHPSGKGFMVPKTTANERDWRLFQELAAQADLVISSGRYLRDWAEGRAQEILRVDDPQFADLRGWRKSHGLPPQPDLAIISGSLDFPIPTVLTAGGRKVVVLTTADPDPGRVAEIEAQAGQVIVAGDDSVQGDILVNRLAELGYRTIFSSAGPKILHLLSAGDVLDRLYLTHANRILGGQPFSSIMEGPLLEPPLNFTLHHIYLDLYALEGSGQLFVSYDRLRTLPG
jgi:riboflavin biosynthesis pyrimidine reductase